MMCLHMAHEDLPKEIHKIFSAKLEHQDVVSLEADIFTRAQLVLEQLEACVGLNHCVFSVKVLRFDHAARVHSHHRHHADLQSLTTTALLVFACLKVSPKPRLTSSKTVHTCGRRTNSILSTCTIEP